MPERPAQNSSGAPDSEDRLDSWKEIAAYLKRGARTVQRWEQEEGLPVHRLRHDKRGSVFAYRSELDGWWASRGVVLEKETPEAAAAAPQRPRRWRLWAGAGVAAVVAALSLWWAASPRRPAKGPLRVIPLTSYPGYESYPAFSPDAAQVAFTWDGERQENSDIYVKLIGSDPPLRLTTHPQLDYQPVWAPDGRSIAFLRSSGRLSDELYLVPALGGAERRLGEIHTPLSDIPRPFLCWSLDGRRLIAPDKTAAREPYALTAISVDSGEKRRLTAPPSQTLGDSSPALAPDGRALAFIRCAAIGACDVYSQELGPDLAPQGAAKRLTSVQEQILSVMWAGGGEALVFVRLGGDVTQLWRAPRTGSAAPRLISSLGSLGLHVTISRQGDRLAYTSTTDDRNVYRVELPAAGGPPGEPVRLTTSTRNDQIPHISPDGKRFVFFSTRSGNPELWIANMDGSGPVQLTSFGGPLVTSPRWSPDGQQIAFDLTVAGQTDIYSMSAAGGQARRLTTEGSNEVVPSWSQDGRSIYFASDRSGEFQVWKMPAAGGPALQITRKGGCGAFESLDGKFLYYAKAYGYGEVSLWRVPAGGGEEIEITGSLWSRHSLAVAEEGLYFLQTQTRPEGYPLCLYRFATRRVETLGIIDKQIAVGLSVWPAKRPRWLLFAARERPTGDLVMVENFLSQVK